MMWLNLMLNQGLAEVKKEYENRTGELMEPFEDWADAVQQKFFECMVNQKYSEFVDFVLGV